ncbi:MAG: hypothetical protein DRH57_08600 [Candidatus Cloacimonadota bacterium]|nr:MAG: hypothetical protein DRH57_08600 [Candidatus Cloacimonadota bacterium]
MIVKQIREIAHKVLDMDITYLETFQGYKGDTVLKVVMDKKEVRDEVARLASKARLSFRADYELDGKYTGAYNIFIAYEDTSIYQLKG